MLYILSWGVGGRWHGNHNKLYLWKGMSLLERFFQFVEKSIRLFFESFFK